MGAIPYLEGMTTQPLSLGNFSVSLAVKDLAASLTFYKALGFEPVGGDGKGYVILQSATAKIGLFQGMLPKNTLTFNPGWDRACNTLPSFTDVRELLSRVKKAGIPLVLAADENTRGPGSFMIMDPDGNPILFDQHV